MRSFFPLFIAVTVVFMVGCSNNESFGSSAANSKAADFMLPQLKGGSASLESLRQGGQAVIFFWATWCPHCRVQLKSLNEKKAELAKLGTAVIVIDIGEDKSSVERFLAGKGYDFNVLLDADGSVSNVYNVLGVPTIVFVGSDGMIRHMGNVFPANYAEILK